MKRGPKQKTKAKAEVALMGIVTFGDLMELEQMASYCSRVLEREFPREKFINAFLPSKGIIPIGMCCSRVFNMPVITFICEAKDTPKPFEEDYGSGYPAAFCYVLNLEQPSFSEYGDCFFMQKGSIYRRVA